MVWKILFFYLLFLLLLFPCPFRTWAIMAFYALYRLSPTAIWTYLPSFQIQVLWRNQIGMSAISPSCLRGSMWEKDFPNPLFLIISPTNFKFSPCRMKKINLHLSCVFVFVLRIENRVVCNKIIILLKKKTVISTTT